MSPPPGLPDPSPEAVPDPSTRVAKPRAFKARRVAAALSVATGLALGGVMAATDASGSTPKATTSKASTSNDPTTIDRPSSGGNDDGYGDGTPTYTPDDAQPHTRSGGS